MAPSARASTGPLDRPEDLSPALAAEARILDHFHYGQVYEQLYNTPARVTGDIATTVGENDSALYTGNYLGAESYRYALAKKKISEGTDVAFWTGQRNEAKSRVDAMVKQYHLLINISKNWKTTFNPQLHNDKPLTTGRIDFGGGVFPAAPGLLFRACTPTPVDPGMEFVNLGRNTSYNRLVGPLKWDDGKNYYCFGATSRDAYAGTTFGLATAFDFVAADDPAMRATIRDDLIAMTSYALKYLWSTPRMHGTVVIPEVEGGNDLDNFISPLFVYTPTAQLNMVQIARHAANVAGTAAQRLKWNAIWAAEFAAEGPQLAGSNLIDASQPHSSYYKFHLNYLTQFNLIRLEPNKLPRQVMRQAFSVMDATTGDDKNALYEAFTFALTGEQSRLEAAVLHHQQWLLYKARLDANGNDTLNSPRCGVDFECVPEGSTEVIVPGLPQTFYVPEVPTASGGQRARFPLDVKDRRGQDFMWQKDPTLLDENQSPEWEPPGYDFLLPYWMIRYYSEAAPPALSPLPNWPGPRFR
jgi:hypothetical protein